MTALSEALEAAQTRAVNALMKAYVAGAFEDDGDAGLMAQLERIGLNDPVDAGYLRDCLDVLRTFGGATPETNGVAKPKAEPASEAQFKLISKLLGEKGVNPDDFPNKPLTKQDAHEVIDSLKSGSYDPAKWTVPF